MVEAWFLKLFPIRGEGFLCANNDKTPTSIEGPRPSAYCFFLLFSPPSWKEEGWFERYGYGGEKAAEKKPYTPGTHPGAFTIRTGTHEERRGGGLTILKNA